MKSSFFKIGLLSAMVSVLVACGGGGGGSKASSTPTPPSSLSGIAAIGAAMAGAKVTLKDSNGKIATATADNNGNFSFSNISGFTAPLMLQAKGTVNGQAYSLHSLLTSAPTTGDTTLNVTPATESLTAQALGTSPTTAFEDHTKFKTVNPDKLAEAKKRLMAALNDTLVAIGLNSEAVDLMTSKFAADQQGLDKLLDLVKFSANSNGEISLSDKTKVNPTPVTIAPNASVSSVVPVKVNQIGTESLDTKGISTLIQALIDSGNSNTPLDRNMFDEKFLFQGADKTSFLTDTSQNSNPSNGKVIFDNQYKIKKCINADKICYVGLQIKTKSSSIVLKNVDMGVKQDSTGTWKLYGDQAPFVFSFTPANVLIESISGSSVPKAGVVINLISLNFPGTACYTCTESMYQRAVVEVSLDEKKGYPIIFAIEPSNNTLMENLTSDNLIGNSNIIKIENNEFVQKLNEANVNGTLKVRVTTYGYDNNPKKTWYLPTFPLLFTSDTAIKEFKTINEWQVKNGLGSQSVDFTGKHILELYAVYKPQTINFSAFLASYDPSVFPNQKITPLETDNVCANYLYKYKTPSILCKKFLNDSTISAVTFLATDDKGRIMIYLKTL